MVNKYFNENMDVIKYDSYLRWKRGKTRKMKKQKREKKVSFITYRKKGLSYRPSISELIKKYEKIVEENPHYSSFQKRLEELYQQANSIKHAEGSK